MRIIFENRRQARKLRWLRAGSLLLAAGSLSWFAWLFLAAREEGFQPGAAEDLGPVALLVAFSLLALAGLAVYGRLYVTRLAVDGEVAAVTTLGLVTPRLHLHQVTEFTGIRHREPQARGVTTPWLALRVAGARLPYILDLQAEEVRSGAIHALLNHGKRRGGGAGSGRPPRRRP